jgi:hypothetical protein
MRTSAPLALLAALGLRAAAAFAAADPAAPPPAAPPPPAGAARVIVETIAVDRRGTSSVGTDQADIFSGGTGVLKRSATLIGRAGAPPPREMIDLSVRIVPTLQAAGPCALRLEAEARGVVAGARPGARPSPPVRRTAAIVLGPDENRLVEVYASVVTQGRLALKVSCAAASSPAGRGGASAGGTFVAASRTDFIDFELSVSRGDDDQPVSLLKTNRLRSGLGREAGNLFSFQLPLPDDPKGFRRYRREKLEITLAPELVSGGRLQVELRVSGELATVSAAEPTIAHPVDHAETLVLASGGAHLVRLDIPSSGDREGWGRVRYEFQVISRFE